MAIYHLSIKIVSRGQGKSAVAAAAYRAAEKITNEREGIIHDYTRKRGVIHTEIMLPENAPAEYSERAVLWNEVEKIEKAQNAQLSREIEVALPVELTAAQNLQLVREYVKSNFVQKGMCADIAIHDKGDGNPHAHIMLTMRPFTEEKKWGSKQRKIYHLDENGERIYDPKKRQYKCTKEETTDWNNRGNAEEWRENWSVAVNKFLELNNIDKRVDNRSYKRQGVDKVPTIHMGAAACQMERKGVVTDRGNHNRNVENINKEIRQLKARLNKIDNWLKEESANTAPPTLDVIISDILSRQAQAGKSQHYQTIYNLKNAAKMLNFLTDNKIYDMAGLNKKVDDMQDKLSDTRHKLKPVERRLKTLDEHIRQADNYKKYKPIKRRYDELHAEYAAAKNATGLFARRNEEKARLACNEYHENYRSELFQFDTAEKYLKDVLQARFNPDKLPPITKWKAERETLTAEKESQYRQYTAHKNEVKELEQMQRSIAKITREETQREQPQRAKTHDIEL